MKEGVHVTGRKDAAKVDVVVAKREVEDDEAKFSQASFSIWSTEDSMAPFRAFSAAWAC